VGDKQNDARQKKKRKNCGKPRSRFLAAGGPERYISDMRGGIWKVKGAETGEDSADWI